MTKARRMLPFLAAAAAMTALFAAALAAEPILLKYRDPGPPTASIHSDLIKPWSGESEQRGGRREALQRGMIQGAAIGWPAAVDFKLTDIAKHHLRESLGGVSAVMIMNDKTYACLSGKAKPVIADWEKRTPDGAKVLAAFRKEIAAIRAAS